MIGAPQSRARGESFGSEVPAGAEGNPAIGLALQGLGGAIQGAADAAGGYFAKQQGQRDEEIGASVIGNSSFQEQYNKNVIDNEAPDGSGLVATTGETFDKYMNDGLAAAAKQGMSQSGLRDLRIKYLNMKKGYVDNSAVAATKMAEDHALADVDKVIATQANDITANGAVTLDQHKKLVATAEDRIRKASNIPNNEKEDRITKMKNDYAVLHFNTLIKVAKTPEDFQILISSLNMKYWKESFSPTAFQAAESALAASAKAMSEIGAENAANPHINNVRADPKTYKSELDAGLKELRKTLADQPLELAKKEAEFKSAMARMQFESRAEQATIEGEDFSKAKSVKDATAGIEALQKELKDPKSEYVKSLTPEAYDQLTQNLIKRKEDLKRDYHATQKELETQLKASIEKVQKQASADMTSILQRLENNENVRRSEMDALVAEVKTIGGYKQLDPADVNRYQKVIDKYGAINIMESGGALNQQTLGEWRRRALWNGDAEFETGHDGSYVEFKGSGKHAPGANKKRGIGPVVDPKDAGKTYRDPTTGRKVYHHGGAGSEVIPSSKGKAIVVASIRDATSVKGMTGRSYQILHAMQDTARDHGVVRLVIVAGRGTGHKSHGSGTEWDIVGYQANGQVWTAAQRAAVARDAAKGGADRFGLYEGGSHRNLLHVGYSHEGFAAAVWGAGGLTGGAASRRFSDPDSQAFVKDFGGGSGTRSIGGAGGGGAGNAGYGVAKRNNPGNLRVSGFTRGQAGFVREEGGFAVFDTVEHGFQAMNNLLDSYARSGQNTISSIINKWAPPSENDTASYIATVAKKLGIDANKELTPEDRANLVRAMTEVEQGHAVDGSVDVGDGSGISVGTGGDGDARTRSDLIEVPEPNQPLTASQHNVIEVIDKKAAVMDAALKDNPMKYASEQLRMPIVPLTAEGGFTERAKLYAAAQAQYGTAAADKPLLPEDVTALSNLLASNNPDQMNRVWASLDTWSPPMQKAAYKQLQQTDPFGATAGRLYANGKKDIANTAVQGHKALMDLKLQNADAAWATDSKKWFEENMLPIMRGIVEPELSAGLKSVADAVYAVKYGTDKALIPEAYQQVMEQVVGRKFDFVNESPVAVPPGTNGPALEAALPVLDMTAISTTHTKPQAEDHVTGVLADITPYAQSRMLPIWLGDDSYAFMDPDGGLLHTIDNEGNGQIYKATLTASVINEAAARAAAAGVDVERAPDAAPSGFRPPGQLFGYPEGYTGEAPAEPPATRAIEAPPAPGVEPPAPGVPTPAEAVRGSASGEARVGRSQQFEVDPEAKRRAMEPKAPGAPLAPAIGLTQKEGPWTPAEEKALEEYADNYRDVLLRNGASKAEADVARSQLLDDIRATRTTKKAVREK
jgi:hypothetical protein